MKTSTLSKHDVFGHKLLDRVVHKPQNKAVDFEETLTSPEASPNSLESRETLNKRFLWMYCVVLGVFILLGFRLFFLQIFSSEYYRGLAFNNRIRIQHEKASRGIVYDSQKRALVKNIPSFNLSIVPIDLPKDESNKLEMIQDISEMISMPREEIADIINNVHSISSDPVLLKENIDRDAALIIEAQYENYPGIIVENSSRREYEKGPLFAHIFGYTGKITQEEYDARKDQGYLLNDTIGKSGIENTYESYIRGEYGKKQVEVDSLGRVENILATKESVPGNNLILSVDMEIQEKMTEFLQNGARAVGSQRAAAVMMNPKTGEILGMVSLPTYDNNKFAQGITQEDYSELANDPAKPLFNRSVSGTYPPGSTIKPIVAAAALEEGIITPQTTIIDTGSMRVPNQYNPDIVYEFVGWNREGLGPMDVYDAIAKSSDIYFYQVAGGFENFRGLGATKLINYYTQFQLGIPLGIDLPNESAGLVPRPEWKEQVKHESWYLGDTYHMAIGQGDVLATPLQVLNFTSTIANGGIIYRPHIVKQIINGDNDIIEDILPVALNQGFIALEKIQIVQRAMRETVLNGSGRLLQDLPVSAAGKTGTAQYSNNEKTHAWFTAYAPYDDPEVALVVLVEDGGEGNKTAVPIANDILRWYFETYKNK